MREARIYRRLRRHMDSLPVGFPRTLSGVELRLLRRIFNPGQALIALGMDHRYRRPGEIAERLRAMGLKAPGDIEAELRAMASRGAAIYREAEGAWALQPFIIGAFEFQVGRMDRGLYEDVIRYLKEGYCLQLLATGLPQTRIVPIGQAISAGPESSNETMKGAAGRIAGYDESRALVEAAGERLAVLPCVCRTGADSAGRPCAHTDRRELCMAFRDYADTVLREGWGRRVSRDEALAILALDAEEGFALRASNEREPQFLCACCGDCCGLLAVAKALPRPADYVATKWLAVVEPGACVGCGLCAARCPMEAVSMDATKDRERPLATVSEARCIGCGVCAHVCKPGAIRLADRGRDYPTPLTTADLHEAPLAARPSRLGAILVGLKAIFGIRKP